MLKVTRCEGILCLLSKSQGLPTSFTRIIVPFVDLNESSVIKVPNAGNKSGWQSLYLPNEISRADIIVSLAKMKTHHWAGVTLSMKNLFGLMPGIVYGWPKNLFHWAGIHECIYDINATVKPHFAIVDGIVGMEGDGPIMGDPVQANVMVMGTNLGGSRCLLRPHHGNIFTKYLTSTMLPGGSDLYMRRLSNNGVRIFMQCERISSS